MNSVKRSRGPAIAAALAAAVGVIIIGGGAVQGIMPSSVDDAMAAASSSCTVSYSSLDDATQTVTNPNKEVAGAIGTPVTQRDEAGIKAELQERRTCGTDGKFDTELTATHYAEWSNKTSTSRKVEYANIDAFRAELNADPVLYAAIQSELTNLENASAFSIEGTHAGMWSVYMKATGDGNLTTHIGRSAHDGTAAVFTTSSGAVIKYRLECGFQILHDSPPAGFNVCEYDECGNPPPPPVVVPPTCPWNPSLPPESPDCVQPKNGAEDVGANPAVDPFLQDGGEKHEVSNGNGATVPNGNQGSAADVAAAQQAAAAAAAAQAAAAQAAHDAAVKAANESGGGSVSDNQQQGPAAPPPADW